ncbi:ABC-type antimicrobial peptide transport system, permease component [Methylophaga frappieri]|uniref:ABC-type antimicrobial peptide transport system, permease component n=1 Tax=Methylophaga frappieri (strain ATCC BAA-2434 / DSM 25690 / JAM7) TaxID=754477 RepID=I1YL28_METFJ|nr:ABC transporter permease [Methylophaga frappieri]AFJ03621.1 ABC-type antimicrobial peptide transport system, permease component [Methylophaga frappieri]
MTMLIKLAWHSMWSRAGSVLLTVMMLAVSILVLVSVDSIRQQTKSYFQHAVSDVDLIVGPRTGQTNLLLYSIFHIGVPSHNLSGKSYAMLQAMPEIDWLIPLSLGDSHRGYRVVGTSTTLFNRFRYADKQPLKFESGQAFSAVKDAVIGAEVARQLNYQIGNEITLAHGMTDVSFARHDAHPFTITGVLEPTGTPLDRSVLVSLDGLDAIHANWPGSATTAGQSQEVTAVMLGLTSKIQTFRVQQQINAYTGAPLQAILPGATLSQLWSMLGGVEQSLQVIAWLVLLAALTGMANVLLLSMRERRQELAVLRALGYPRWFLFMLLQIEALLITLAAILLAMAVLWPMGSLLRHWLLETFGLYLPHGLIQLNTLPLLLAVLLAAIITALWPGIQAYRQGLGRQLD